MNGVIRLVGLAVLGVASGTPVSAQDAVAERAAPADIAGLLEPIREKAGVPALGACAVRGGAVVAIGAVGQRARGDDARVTVDDRWHLGSCTKAMTATLCGVLVDAGAVQWDTTLGDAFADLAPAMHGDWRDVTLEQLLTHRSGLPANPNRGTLWMRLIAWDGTTRAAREQVVREMLSVPPEHAPGSAFLYSNAGYMVAGAMLEQRTDRSWEDLMREKLFAPLGITTAGFGPPGSADVVDQPRAHRKRGSGIPPGPAADNPAALGPAGTVHMSLGDWAKFLSLHLGVLDGEAAVVTPETLAHLQRGIARDGGDAYACGFGVTRRGWADGPILTHAGSNTMWFVVCWLAPDEDFAVLAVTNQAGPAAEQATDAACAALIRRD